MEILETWAHAFLTGWQNTGAVVAMCLGGAAAVVLGLIVAALFAAVVFAIAGRAFDVATNAMAKRWEKTGRRPATRWAEAIARGRRHEE